jgi:hypothetical protein
VEAARTWVACHVEDAMDFDRVIANGINDHIGETRNDKLARAWHASRGCRVWVTLQSLGRPQYPRDDAACRCRILAADIVEDLGQMARGAR